MEIKRNRIYLALVFIVTGFYTLINPKPALEIIEAYQNARDAYDKAQADKDL